ncbi:pharyngeal muscle protein 2-like [Diabrotica virgifera virgifera]|uniref:SAP domain-containing protein n=1 Tax=Diabrotica virgifera virgifera TaxID=50390 RepID=A0ABM5JZW6_DIAVI|nr:pharyngeal muscle protein 2-like [Diabrotica virgifera virgifera]
MSSQCKPKLSDLRLTELRTELENRELDAAGKKADLVVRLKNALQEEGHDPETYVFEDRQTALISSISKEISQMKWDGLYGAGEANDKGVQMVDVDMDEGFWRHGTTPKRQEDKNGKEWIIPSGQMCNRE